MTAGKWAEILVGVVILATLGWLGTQVFSIGRAVSTIQTQVISIADELPEVRRNFAWRELDAAFRASLVVSRPLKSEGGGWRRVAVLRDRTAATRVYYEILLSYRDDQCPPLALSGGARHYEPYAASFAELQQWSREVGDPLRLPSTVDPDVSYLFRKPLAPEYVRIIEEIGRTLRREEYRSQAADIQALVDEIRSSDTLFQSGG
jgi:hypothetical protein